MIAGRSRAWLFIAGVALILAANAVALLGVAYNRSGEPESVLPLTERELALPWRTYDGENSGIALTIRWRVPDRKPDRASAPTYYYSGLAPAWLDKAKLSELGFDVSRSLDTPAGRRHYEKLLAKEVLLVLELDGPAYQAMLERAREHARSEAELASANPRKDEFKRRAQSAKQDVYLEERANSRLFVIDAGSDASALRARYPDRSRYAIARGQVKPSIAGRESAWYLAGYVTNLSVDRIQVPFAYREIFEPLFQADGRNPSQREPRYEAAIAFGNRFEPWIKSVFAPVH